MNNTTPRTNVEIILELDTIADIVEYDIKTWERTMKTHLKWAEAENALWDLSQSCDAEERRLIDEANTRLDAIRTRCTTELRYWADRLDRNMARYDMLRETLEKEHDEPYYPERGYHPQWPGKKVNS